MLSTSHSFLFVHVPKTGGNSVQDALREYSADSFVCLAPHQDGIERFELRSSHFPATVKHTTLYDYKRSYPPRLYERLFKFSIVRNPWERCVSHYFSPHRGPIAWNPAAFLDFITSSAVRPFDEYADPVALDCVLRFEALECEFKRLCAYLGLPNISLPRRNSGPGYGDWRDYYDLTTAKCVARRFASEITWFGYTGPY